MGTELVLGGLGGRTDDRGAARGGLLDRGDGLVQTLGSCRGRVVGIVLRLGVIVGAEGLRHGFG